MGLKHRKITFVIYEKLLKNYIVPLPKIEEVTVGQAHVTLRNIIEIFRQARPSFSIRREQMFVNT